MGRKKTVKFWRAERPSASERHKWNKVLCEHHLGVNEGRFLRDENGKYIRGAVLLPAADLYKPRHGDDSDDSDMGNEDIKYDEFGMAYGYAPLTAPQEEVMLGEMACSFQEWWAGKHEDERLDNLVERFLKMSPGEAEAHFGMNRGTAYRLKREFCFQSDRTDIDVARRVLGYSEDDCREERQAKLVEILNTYRFLAGKAA